MFGAMVILLILTLFVYNFYWKRRNLPPGPTPIPLLGNILSFAFQKHPYECFFNWHKRFGPIHTYWIGEKPLVVVSEYNLIKETFIKDGDSYTGRDFFEEMQHHFKGGNLGITSIEGEFWKNQRRFALHTLRNFGMGRKILETTILTEVGRLLDLVRNNLAKGQEVQDFKPYIEICVGSVINQLLLGHRFYGDNEKQYYYLKKNLDEFIELFSCPAAQLMNMTSTKFWGRFPHFKTVLKDATDCGNRIMAFFDQQIELNQKMFSSDETQNDEPTIYVQAFLIERNKRLKNEGDVGDFTVEQLRSFLMDVWLAGQDTTSTTLQFGLLYLLTHRRAQEKLYQELQKVVGHGNMVTLDDRQKLPYTNAVVNEIQRTTNLLSFNLFHKTTRDVAINGYNLPEGTTIFPQISTVLYDEKIFPKPEKFIPERFLDSNGKHKKIDELIPFSVGKRQCLGESLARDELFLFIANIFNILKLLPEDPKNPPSLKKTGFFGVKPIPYKVRVEKR